MTCQISGKTNDVGLMYTMGPDARFVNENKSGSLVSGSMGPNTDLVGISESKRPTDILGCAYFRYQYRLFPPLL